MEKYTKKQPLSSLKPGDVVNDVFVVKIKKAMGTYKNGHSFDLLLSDNSGKTVDYKYWGSADEKKVKFIYDLIKADSVVLVQGKASSYNGKLQITTNEPNTISVLKPNQYDVTDFIKPAKRDLDRQYAEIVAAINGVHDAKIRMLLEKIFFDNDFKEKFKIHPGAIEIHHNWVGGLLQHTIEVLHYCRIAADLNPDLNKDLLVAGALLHDVGKLEELETTSRIKGTQKGQLAGHLVLSAIFVSKRMDELNFDDALRNKILHIVVSHHGRIKYGSPKEPMFPEALAVYYADEMSSKIAEMLEFVNGAKEDTEDDFMYSKRNERNVLLR